MIWRALYVVLLRLHPRTFRESYSREMLWVFDQEIKTRRPYGLVWDAARSAIRQHWRRPTGESPAVKVAAGPAFFVFDDGALHPAQLLQGLVATAATFGLILAAAIQWGSFPGTLRLPTIYTYRKSPPPNYDIDWGRLRALDMDGDGWIDPVERSAQDALRWERLFRKAPSDSEGRVSLADLRPLLVAARYP